MTLREIVELHFDATIKAAQIPTELRYALKKSEHRQKAIDGITGQILSVKRTRQFTSHEIKQLVESLTQLFLLGIQKLHDKRNMSHLEKSRIIAEAQRQEALEKTANGTPTGDYAEILEANHGTTSD